MAAAFRATPLKVSAVLYHDAKLGVFSYHEIPERYQAGRQQGALHPARHGKAQLSISPISKEMAFVCIDAAFAHFGRKSPAVLYWIPTPQYAAPLKE